MARLTLILTVLTTVVALLGGFRLMLDIIQHWRWRRKVTGKWLAALALLTSLWSVPDANAAGRVFFDGSEAGNTDLWGQDSGRPKCTSVSSSADGLQGPYAGTYMIQCNDPGAAWQTLKGPTFTFGSEVLYRIRIRLDSNHDGTGGSAKKIARIFYWTGDFNLYCDVFAGASSVGAGYGLHQALIIDGDSAPNYWGDATGDHTADPANWHQLEYYINTSTGASKVWHDDILVQNEVFGSVQGEVGQNGDFYITSNWEETHDATNYIYFDNVEIFTDTGTGGTGSLSDGTITQGGGSTVVMFREWIPLIIGILWHARTWLVGVALLIGGATVTTASLAAQKTKQLSTTATISTLNVVSSVLGKVKR